MRVDDRTIWELSPGGVLVPGGSQTSIVGTTIGTYLESKEKALRLQHTLTQAGVVIHPHSGIGKLITSAKSLSDAWFCNGELTLRDLVRSGYLNHIADVVLGVDRRNGVSEKTLRDLVSGELDNAERGRSIAKDAFWELEVLHLFRRYGACVRMIEPPDLRIEFPKAHVGVACKRLYSESQVSKVLSKGVSQIEQAGGMGIVALKLDDLLPRDALMQVANARVIGESLVRLCFDFLGRHERHLLRYLTRERLIGALISFGTVADLKEESTRFVYARQFLLWTLPDLSPPRRRLADQVKQLIVDGSRSL